MAKTSKSAALKKASALLGRTFRTTKACSTAGSTLATDRLSRKKKSKAGSKLASVHKKPHCKATGRRKA